MKKLRIGLVATGLIGRQHAEALGRIPGTELAALAEGSQELCDKMSAYYGITGYTSWKEMIDNEKLDVIHNCTPNSLHYEINKYALEKGIHVYSEKPLAVTIREGEELTALAKMNKLANGVNFNYRNNAMVQEMRARMAKNDPGRCLVIHGQYIQDWLLYKTDYNWRVETADGGESRAIADIGSHWFDTMQVVTGKKVAAVYAKNIVAHKQREKSPGTMVDVATEDGSLIMFELTDGTTGTLVVSQISAGYKNHIQFSFDCEKYSMRWNQEQSDRLMIGTRENGVQHIYSAPDSVDPSVSRYATLPSGHPVGWADAFTNGFREFYRSIADGTYSDPEQTYSDFANATYIMKIVDACMRSSETKQWVAVK